MAKPSQSTKTTFERVLQDFKDKLSPEQRKEFSMTTIEELELAVVEIQDRQAAKGDMKNLNRIKGFLEAMKSNSAIIEVFLNVHPFVAFIWGPMKFVLQVASTLSDAFSALLNAYERIGECLPQFVRYQQLFEDDLRMRHVLEVYFQDLFEFHLEAVKYFNSKFWKKLFSATWKTFNTKFERILDNIRRHKRLVETEASLIEYENAKFDRMQRTTEFEMREKQEHLRRKGYLGSWLAGPDVRSDQENGQLARKDCPNSGKWILAKQAFRTWFDLKSASPPCLWIHGKPGAGKTVLASVVIDVAHSRKDTSTFYFYCHCNDNHQNTFLAMARSFLSQLVQHDDGATTTFLYEKATAEGEACLRSRKSAEQLLENCFQNLKRCCIVLDGLDECADPEQEAMVSWLMRFVNGNDEARCLFLSQRHDITRKLLGSLPTIEIRPIDNIADIHEYCQVWSQRIQSKFDIDDEESANIALTTSNRANGMFLFAKLVMGNILDQTNRAGLRREMRPEVFPTGLEQAYKRIFDRVLAQPGSRRDALRLLAWVACAVRSLQWREAQAANIIAGKIEENEQAEEDLYCEVHLDDLRWKVDHTGLCGPLIEKRPNGNMEIVHYTARQYMIDYKILVPRIEHLKLAILCLGYLSQPAFGNDLAGSEYEYFVLNGEYAFLDYALISWPRHIKTAMQDEPLESSTEWTSAVEMLKETLDPFFGLHWRDPKRRSQVAKSIVECVQTLRLFHHQDKLMQTMASMRSFTSQEVTSMTQYTTLDLYTTLASIRAHTETLASQPGNTPILNDWYGKQIYKCPRLYCEWFYEGFETDAERKEHVAKHERSFYCPHPDCPQARLGCKTAKELEAHMAKYHSPQPKDTDFQPLETKMKKAPNGNIQCHKCEKTFTRRSNMLAHMRTHTDGADKKPHKCTTCGKGFAKDHDRKVHEKIHEQQEENITCYGNLASGQPWGCGRPFPNTAALLKHFDSKTARKKCIRPLLDEELARRKEQTSKGSLTPITKQLEDEKMTLSSLSSLLTEQCPSLEDVEWTRLAPIVTTDGDDDIESASC